MKKDDFLAKLSFYISLGFWIPLFNIGISVAAFILGYKAVKLYLKEPKKYGGLYFALTAIILSVTSVVLTLIGFYLYIRSEQICNSVVCQSLNQ